MDSSIYKIIFCSPSCPLRIWNSTSVFTWTVFELRLANRERFGPPSFYFIFLFFREREKEKEWERNINLLLLVCTSTGNRTGDLSLCGTTPNSLSYTGQAATSFSQDGSLRTLKQSNLSEFFYAYVDDTNRNIFKTVSSAINNMLLIFTYTQWIHLNGIWLVRQISSVKHLK